MAELEDILAKETATRIMDPTLNQSIASLHWFHPRIAVSEEDTIQLVLKLPSLLHPKLNELKDLTKSAVIDSISKWNPEFPTPRVNVEALLSKPIPMMSRLVEDDEELLRELGPGLSSVAHCIGVYSCKGGVGKSTIAVNLAYELAHRGGRVGLVDLDIYGPSLPVLVKPDDLTVRSSPVAPGLVEPISYKGVKMLSLGFVNRESGVQGSGQNNGASIMRGPLAVKVVAQLLKGTNWGELDVLILDLPPGTGDVQLAVLQDLQLSGSVAVTTPSRLSIVDTAKGIEMFTSLGVPSLSVVENMSHFEIDGVRHYPFGKRNDLKEVLNCSQPIIEMPMSPHTIDSTDSGIPLTMSRCKGAEPVLSAFSKLADAVSSGIMRYQYHENNGNRELVTFENENQWFPIASLVLSMSKDWLSVRLISDEGAITRKIATASLRSRDPKTGDYIPDSPFLEDVTNEDKLSNSAALSSKRPRSPSITAKKVKRKGRYGFAVEWGDGATVIYSLRCIAQAAGGKDGRYEELRF